MEWSKLRSREKKAVLILAFAAIFGTYIRFVDKPVSSKMKSYKDQTKRLDAQLRDLNSKQPQDSALSKRIDELKQEELVMTAKVEELEDQVPSRLYASQLVGEFTRLAKEVKLDSIKQRIIKEQTYSRIILEVKFYSSYVDAVKYVAAVESISPFLRVEEFEILEAQGKVVELGGAPVSLIVSCLLSESESRSSLTVKQVPEITVTKDILTSSSKPAKVLSDEQFILEGITFNPKNPSAIINGDVFRINDEMGGYKVKKILSDSVVLSDGVEEHLLSLKTVSGQNK